MTRLKEIVFELRTWPSFTSSDLSIRSSERRTKAIRGTNSPIAQRRNKYADYTRALRSLITIYFEM